MRFFRETLLVGIATFAVAAPAHAQDEGGDEPRAVSIHPYIEVSQVLSAQLSPGDEVLTFPQVAVGVDVCGAERHGSQSGYKLLT